MKILSNSTIITHADVYMDEMPSTSDRSKPKQGGRHNFGRPKKESGGKKYRGTWIFLNKKKRNKERDGIIMSGDSPPPLHSSVPSSPTFDAPDDVRPGKTSPAPVITKQIRQDADAEVIEEDVPIMTKTLPMPEPQPKIENGFDHIDGAKNVKNVDDDSCVVKCVYFAQQCCECTIL